MLFEDKPLTPEGRRRVPERLLARTALRPDMTPSRRHVSKESIAAYGEFSMHLRFLLEASPAVQGNGPKQRARLRRLHRMAESLPAEMANCAAPTSAADVVAPMRRLALLLQELVEAGLCPGEEDYEALLRKAMCLVEAVYADAPVSITPSSVFLLLLMTQRPKPVGSGPHRRRRRSRKSGTDKVHKGKSPA
ncbi:MAG: hypothetical protein ACI4PY_03165 [Akkermansia muciniphila]